MVIDQLQPTLPWGPRVVLTAPTGTGKSTRVPLWFAEEGRVLVIQPRRVACRSLSRYLRQHTPHSVGFAVRFERESEDARILYVTTGVALRLAANGQLANFSTILLDEFHERTQEQDLLLALLPHKAAHSRWILMSATLEREKLTHFQPQHCPSPGFPVAVHYLGGPTVPSRENLTRRVQQAVHKALLESSGNVLVFLPGVGEIQECRSALRGCGAEVIPLHGSLSGQEQDRAFQTGPRRVVLATNVAETSVTLPGITAVVDSGLVRQKIHRKGFSALSTEAISLASAEQRRGRAGRTEPGLCLRLWQKDGKLETSTDPEILRLDLTDLVTQAAACGTDALSLQFLDPPPEFALLTARSRLQNWGVLSDAGQLALPSLLPLPIELARLAPLAQGEVLEDFLDLCAILQTRGSLFENQPDLELRQKELPGCRLASALLALRKGQPRRHALNAEMLQQAREMSQQLRSRCALPLTTLENPHLDRLALFLARHWSERVFVRRPHRDAFVNHPEAIGTLHAVPAWEVALDHNEGLPESIKAIILLEIMPLSGRGLRVELKGRYALPCTPALLREAGLGQEQLDSVAWRGRRVVGIVARSYAGLELSREEQELNGPLLRDGLCQLLLRGTLWRPELEELAENHRLHRLNSLLQEQPDPGPFEAALAGRITTLGVENGEDVELIGPADLATCTFFEEERVRLAQLFPAQIARGGAVYSVDYQPEHRLITLHWRSGSRNITFPTAQLPRWSHWRVQLNERGRLISLR